MREHPPGQDRQTAEIAEVFDVAGQNHDAASALLWGPLGEEFVRLVEPVPGDRVFDAGCGAGASALPAARAVGGAGRVDAVDVADGVLDLGRARARAEDLKQLCFHAADVTGWSAPEPYDLVLCGYGVFFFPDMDVGARRLAGLARPGGRFSVAVWARGALESFGGLLHRTVAAERADGPPGGQEDPPARRASMRIGTEDDLRSWMASLGLDEVQVHRIAWQVDLNADNAWDLVLGTGFRAMLHGLDASAVNRVRDRFLTALTAERVESLDATSLVAVGRASQAS